ncbi:MAG: DUF2283 domain-containing protein [Flavobacteriales bacterium]|jgi:uncharacterized protein YuzE|nr:DUF2283 domain-containing protein [Flavobacteriales bacterium]
MTLTYDPRYNIAYIKLREKTATVNSVKVSEEVVIDLGEDGTIYGIELLNAKKQLQDKNSLHLLFINEATGEEKTIEIAA